MKKSLSRKVLEVLRDSAGASLKEISVAVEASPGRVRGILYELRAKGYVERVGNTYIITDRGRRYLEYVEHTESSTTTPFKPEEFEPRIEKIEPTVEEREVVKKEEKPGETRAEELREEPRGGSLIDLEAVSQRLVELERRVSNLERAVKDLEKAMEAAFMKRRTETSLEAPVMPYSYAASKLGSLLEKLLAENKLVRVGSLVVDTQFYSEFRSKFPIKISELDKLAPHERALLEEMRKEALVILHAGREYRLVD